MGKLRDDAEALGIEVDGRWSNATLQRKINEIRTIRAKEEEREKVPEQPVSVRLLKNYKPIGWYEVQGHFDAEEEFVKGQPAPPPYPGVHFEHKLWAGTVVKLPAEEARSLVEHADMMTVMDRDPDTRMVIGRRSVKKRRPLAEVHVVWDGKVDYAA
jgi:hypothetical protein